MEKKNMQQTTSNEEIKALICTLLDRINSRNALLLIYKAVNQIFVRG